MPDDKEEKKIVDAAKKQLQQSGYIHLKKNSDGKFKMFLFQEPVSEEKFKNEKLEPYPPYKIKI